jgi:hypothetical protein
MKAKFVWNGQVIEHELRAMSDVPNNKRNVIALEVIDATYVRTLWWGEVSKQWFGWFNGLTDFEISNYIGWCEMPELVEVVE